MDNVTHTLFALTLARTPLTRGGRGTTTALVLASNAPDIDIVAALGGTAKYLAWHRGPTHGPLGVAGLGLLTAALVWSTGRFFAPAATRTDSVATEATAPFARLLVVSLVGVLAHVLMDVPTSYGTRLLSPFDWRWFAADWLPIVDIYLLVALAACLAFGRMSAEARRYNVAIALALMTVNYGVRGVAHHEALMLTPRLFGPTLPQPCDPRPLPGSPIDSWPRATATLPDNGKRCLVEVAAVPTFVSPFRWRLIARLSNAYEIHDVDLLDRRFRTPAPPSEALWRRVVRLPNDWTPAVAQAARTRTAQIFLGFSRFPDARVSVDPAGVTTVRLTDIRFVAQAATLQQQARQFAPFTVTVQLGPDGAVLEENMGQ